MKPAKKHFSLKSIFLVCIAMVSLMDISYANYFKGYLYSPVPTAKTPDGYAKYITFIGDGVYKSPDGSIMKGGIANANEFGLIFQREIMGRSEEEIEEHKQRARDFFLERFGFDAFSDPNIWFFAYEVDPKNQIRAYTVSADKAPRKGWFVNDGGFMAMVTNPEGLTLGGESEGVHVPAQTAFVFGEYQVMRTIRKRGREVSDPFVIRYRSRDPLQFTQFGALIGCELSSDEFGPGVNSGIVGAVQLGDGYIQPNIKSILTFSELGPNTMCNSERF